MRFRKLIIAAALVTAPWGTALAAGDATAGQAKAEIPAAPKTAEDDTAEDTEPAAVEV